MTVGTKKILLSFQKFVKKKLYSIILSFTLLLIYIIDNKCIMFIFSRVTVFNDKNKKVF